MNSQFYMFQFLSLSTKFDDTHIENSKCALVHLRRGFFGHCFCTENRCAFGALILLNIGAWLTCLICLHAKVPRDMRKCWSWNMVNPTNKHPKDKWYISCLFYLNFVPLSSVKSEFCIHSLLTVNATFLTLLTQRWRAHFWAFTARRSREIQTLILLFSF